MKLVKNMFFKKEELINLLLIQLTIILLLSFLSIFLTLAEIAFGGLELILFFGIMILSTYKYQHYSDENLLKRFEVNSFKKQRLKIILFLYLVFFGIFIILVFLLGVYIFSFFTSGTNIVGTQLSPINGSLNYFSYDAYFYYAFFELLIIITFSYMINHFFKKKKLMIYGITIILFIYILFFGNVLQHYLDPKTIEGYEYIVGRNIGNTQTIIKSILTPWTSFGMGGKKVFMLSNRDTTLVKGGDYSYLSYNFQYSFYFNNLYGIPFLGIGIYMMIPTSLKLIKSQSK